MLRSGQVVSGGSTLTMQVARILETDPEASTRTPWGKALRSLRAQLVLSREQADGWQVLDALAEPLAALSTHVLALAEAVTLSSEDLGRLRVWLSELQRQAGNARRYLDELPPWRRAWLEPPDRKSTRLNSSHECA